MANQEGVALKAWTNESVRETLLHTTLENGLQVFLLPKRGFRKSFATFSTHYGSIDRTFVPVGGKAAQVFPDGIAHFLEHKLFEEEKGDATDRFAEIGASSNAFTNYTSTTYLFSATDDFDKGVGILLDFVQHPYFTPESVDREKGIIEQEIRMYLDDPGWHLFHNLTDALFVHHPVRVEVAGTVKSIQNITVDHLRMCYDTFYRPENMVFFAVGDLDPERTLEVIRQGVRMDRPTGPIERVMPEEPDTVREPYVERRMPVSRPSLLLGFKEAEHGPGGYVLREVATALLLEVVFGASSELYDKLYERGLIDDRLSLFSFGTPAFGATVIGGETTDPDALAEALLDGIQTVQKAGISEEAFERARRKALGEVVGLFDSPEAIAFGFVDAHFKGVSLFDELDALHKVERGDLERRLREHLVTDRMSRSVIRPLDGAAQAGEEETLQEEPRSLAKEPTVR